MDFTSGISEFFDEAILINIGVRLKAIRGSCLAVGRIPHHPALGSHGPRPHPTLFPRDTQWREGLDCPRGTWAALRGAPRYSERCRCEKPSLFSLNPNNKIPAIIDPNGPNGQPLGLFESGAILVYLAEKTDRLLGASAVQRYEAMQWLMFQMGGVGPMFGQLGFFYAFAGREIPDPRPRERYIAEVKRLLNVIDGYLEGRDWIAGDY